MKNDWEKEFEEFEIKLDDQKVYIEEFYKWYFKVHWVE